MRFGVLGTGVVGRTIGEKLVARGHDVKLGSRSSDNPDASSWSKAHAPRGSHGTFQQAAVFGEIVFNCTNGERALDALRSAGASALRGKVLIDVTNPLDFSRGMPPTLFVQGDDSLGEQIQRAFPESRVVKTLNTVTAGLMTEPQKVGNGDHQLFVCGNDGAAKKTVTSLLKEEFGWKEVLDLGDISMARGAEAYLLLWVRLYQALGTPEFNLRIVK